MVLFMAHSNNLSEGGREQREEGLNQPQRGTDLIMTARIHSVLSLNRSLSSLRSVQCPGHRQQKLTISVIQICDFYRLNYLPKVILRVLSNPFLFSQKNTMSPQEYILYSCGSDNFHIGWTFISLASGTQISFFLKYPLFFKNVILVFR